MSPTSKTITALGIFILFVYIVTSLLNFYGVGTNVYGIYLVFYLFIIISYFILPTNYPTL